MKKVHSLLIAAAVVGLAATGWLAFPRGPEPGETSAPRTSPPAPPAPRHSEPADRGARDLVWCRRIGDEVLAMVRKPGGQPDAGATLRFFDPGDAGSGIALEERTDSSGLFRGTVPGAFTRVHLAAKGEAAGDPDPVAIPGEPSSNRTMLSDRAELKPGDRFRLCILVGKPTDPGVPAVGLRFEGPQRVDPAGPLPGDLKEEANPAGPDPFPCWKVFEGTVPDDAPIGSAVVSRGADEIRIPVVARFGPGARVPGGAPPTAHDPGGGESDGTPAGHPDTPPTPPVAAPPAGALALEARDGEWHAKGPFDATAILFFAEAGSRLLAHQGAIALDGEAAASLPLGDRPPAGARVTAVAATPKGFLEASVPVPGADGEPPPPSDSDAVLADFLAESRRAEPLPTEPNPEPVLETRGVAVRPGVPETLFRPGEVPDPETEIRWEVEPRGVVGSLRIRSGRAILLEARVSGEADGGAGTLRAGDVGVRPVLVETSAPGLRAVAFSWSAPPAAGESPARPGRLVSLERVLPSRGRRGEEAECRIVVRVGEPCLCAVTCPVPGGAVPAEDGWSVRARAPAGTRVGVKAAAVSFLVPMGKPGEAVLSFRIRFAAPGTFTAPAASVACSDLDRPGAALDRAYSASGLLAVE